MKKFWIILLLINVCFFSSCENKGSDLTDSTKQPIAIKPTDQATAMLKDQQKPPTESPEGLKIKWYDYEEGMALAKSLNKKILLTFYTDWCRYCREMDLNTFSNRFVVSYLNEHFISIRVNSEKDFKTANKYNVRGIPVTWFIEENGENIGSQPGYISAEALLPLLKYIHTDSYKKMKYADFLKSMG